MSRPPIAWPRLLVEGLVIVVSILLAFAIDAWWEDRQEAEEARLQIERVVAELESNAVLLEDQIGYLDVTTDAAKRFLAKFGPNPDAVEKSVVGDLFNGLFASGTIALDRSASQNFLASGLMTKGEWLAIRHDLSALMAQQDRSEKRSVELRKLRPSIHEYVGHLMPALDTAMAHELMADYSPSRFPYDPSVMFSDMYLEGLISGFAIRMEINRSGNRRLLEEHLTLLDEIRKAGRPL